MKILYLKLKNYASIYTAMGLKEIEIDFSKSKNNVILFVGKNGSGKTSLLSALHPFPYYGSMDPRNGTSIIREDKDGFKEIHIKNNDDVYKIQHHYKNSKKGIVLKCFIQKNNEELNPNGNVTSFNDIVKQELSLELDFLRLLRLGSNVTNLIDMKASERKSFTSYLLSDINIYNSLFKKVNEDSRLMKSMIRTVSDKLIKLNVLDKGVLESNITELENKLVILNSMKDSLQHELGSIEGKINSLVPEGINETESKKISLESDLARKQTDLKTLNKSLDNMCVILVYNIEKEKELRVTGISMKENEKNVNEDKILFFKEQLSSLYNKKAELENILKTSVSDITHREMTELYVSILEKIKVYDKKFSNYTPSYTKDNLISLLEALKHIDSIANEIYGFDAKARVETVRLIRESINVPKYINDNLKDIDSEILKISSNLKSTLNPSKTPVILFKPNNCVEPKCPYMFLYDLIFSDNSNNDSKSLTSLENKRTILENISYINKNIEYIFMVIKTNMNIISKSDISFFKIDNILNCIEQGQSIFNEDYMTDLISDAEEYEEYLTLKTKVKELKAELNLINSNNSIIDSTKKEILSIDNDITNILGKISTIEKQNSLLNDIISNLRQQNEYLNKYSEYITLVKDTKTEITELQSKIKDISNILENVSELNRTSVELKKRISINTWEIDKVNTELFDLKVKLKDFISLSNEQAILNEKFDDINLIRESLSSNKGIPLLYMQLYLKNTKMFVNELLKIAYSDNFEIDDFDINESEFNIPYIKNNIRISDVMYASQGEKSFLSLALSFALINQSIKDYNILLLDEIDSTLDTRNRAMFLNILEKQMESINSEQIFLITHNNMFENYPVDIILTSNDKVNNFNNANILYSV